MINKLEFLSEFFLVILLILVSAFGANSQQASDFGQRLSAAAIELTRIKVTYDPSYVVIDYPNGDIPENKGVCTDLIIRTYRKVGIDLQQKVHEDMIAYFEHYPKIWGLTKPDKNIDHRRVPNLMAFFERHGKTLTTSLSPEDYKPGDIITWDLGGGVPHIGIVIHKKSEDNMRYLVVHNIGNGQEISDCMFIYKITGHYQYPK